MKKTLHTQDENIDEIEAFAKHNKLKLTKRSQHTLEGFLVMDKGRGNVEVSIHSNHFSNSGSFGPFITLPEHIAKGFGLHMSSFNPHKFSFKFDPQENTLSVWSEQYQFNLLF
jgi:hypothetical protein